jgi:hypothetical protein
MVWNGDGDDFTDSYTFLEGLPKTAAMPSKDDSAGEAAADAPQSKIDLLTFNRAKRCLLDNGIMSDDAETVLQALCSIITGEETKHLFYDAATEVKRLKGAGVTFEQVWEEVEYRAVANIDGPEPDSHTCGWDDELCMYNTHELEKIAVEWYVE